MSPIPLREATHDDVALLLSLIHQSFEEYRTLLDPPSGAHRETLDTVRQKMVEGGAFIAWVGDEAVGCVIYEPRESALYLGRLAVLPMYRKQGIGRRLVEAVENRARDLQLPKITLGVRMQLPGNRAFFERLGYQVIAYHSHDGHTELTFMTLEKSVTPSYSQFNLYPP